MDIYNRLPKQREIAPVYAVIVLMVYGWTILKFNYYLPGWLYFLNLGEIAANFAYAMVVNLLESLVVLLGVVALAFILPKRWFADAFIARGTSLTILTLGLMMVIASQFRSRDDYPAELIRWSPLLLLLIAGIVYFLGNEARTRRVLEFFADRALIFLYITIPLSMISFLVVLFRLIW